MLAWWIGIVRSVVAQRIRAIRQIRGSCSVLVLPLKKTLVAAERSETVLGNSPAVLPGILGRSDS